jgi:hypothetical protein
MEKAQDKPITLLAMGDELLLSIMELLRMADVLSCSLVSGSFMIIRSSNVILTRIGQQTYPCSSRSRDDSISNRIEALWTGVSSTQYPLSIDAESTSL